MDFKIVLFFISIIIVLITSVLIYMQRLGDAGDRRMKGFYPLCIVTLAWIVLDTVKLFAAQEYFPYAFVAKIFIACIVPYITFWFILNFTESKLAHSGIIKIILIAIPALDNILLVSNPLHRLYYANFDHPDPSAGTMPPIGPLFFIHIAFISLGVLFFYTILFRYIVKNFRRYPFLIISGIGAVLPFFLNIAFALNILGLAYDFSPIGFFCTILLFTYFSYSSRARNYRPELFNNSLVKISKSPLLSAGNIDEAVEMIVREGCMAIGSHHVGMWKLDGVVIKNTIHYELKKGKCRVQDDIDLSDCPEYIQMLLNERRIVINDVKIPNVLSPIMKYYNPDICAILDTPIRKDGKLIGVICVEQHKCQAFPERRNWTIEEQDFASSLADLLVIAIASAERRVMTLRTETMMNNLPGMLYQGVQAGEDFNFSFVSEGSEPLLGYTPAELINTNMAHFINKIMSPQDIVSLAELETVTLDAGLPLEFVFKGITKKGDEKWIWGRSRIVEKNPDGSPHTAEGFYIDITERRRLEQAELANKAKDRFLAHMSHEMRTPMNALLGIAEIQLQNETLPADVAEAFGQIYDSGDLLLNIINDMLDLSRIEAGKMELVPVNYDIPSLINDTAQLNRLRYESSSVDFILQIDENTPNNLYGDELRIKQVLNNVLSNAFKYTSHGTIEFSVSCEHGDETAASQPEAEKIVTLVFSVKDTGQGMTEEQISKLFDEYTRFNADANRETAGTGLGMNIVKRLVNLMNGNISIQSELGIGSLFTVRIPQKQIGAAVCGADIAKKLRDFRFQSMVISKKVQFLREYMPYGKVLVVDDVESNVYVAKGLLSPYGLTIETSSSGFDAIKKIENGNVYDIIFMDYMMPRMDGIEAAKIIRVMGYSNAIIALTANALLGQEKMFLENGFDGFISKPIDSRELNHVLNEFIRNKKPPEVVEAARREQKEKEKKNSLSPQTAAQNDRYSKLKLKTFFLEDAKNAVDVLENLNKKINILGGEELKLFITTVHGMKSALANIGENELSGFALQLEQAGEQRNLDIMANDTSILINDLKLMIEKYKPEVINSVPGESGEIEDEDMIYLGKKMLEIKTACAAFEKNVITEVLDELKRKTWTAEINAALDEIALQVLHSAFRKAAVTAEKYIR